MHSQWWRDAMRPLVHVLLDVVLLRRSVATAPLVLHGEFLEWGGRMVRVADAATWHGGQWVTPGARAARGLAHLVDLYALLLWEHECDYVGPSR